MDQIVKSLQVHARNGIGEARIQLRPEHLGAVSILLKVEGGAVTAVVRADSPQVQEWILSHQHSLRQQLEAAGLRLDDLTVSPDDERRKEQGEPPPSRPPRRRFRHGDDAERLFDLFA
jgi:flagellar hook-length control protein FliK